MKAIDIQLDLSHFNVFNSDSDKEVEEMNKYTNDTKWSGVANALESKINIIKTILIIYKDGLITFSNI